MIILINILQFILPGTGAEQLTSMTILPAGCPSTVMSKNTFGLAIARAGSCIVCTEEASEKKRPKAVTRAKRYRKTDHLKRALIIKV